MKKKKKKSRSVYLVFARSMYVTGVCVHKLFENCNIIFVLYSSSRITNCEFANWPLAFELVVRVISPTAIGNGVRATKMRGCWGGGQKTATAIRRELFHSFETLFDATAMIRAYDVIKTGSDCSDASTARKTKFPRANVPIRIPRLSIKTSVVPREPILSRYVTLGRTHNMR